ncbi:hypothetical protein AB0I28_14880 [Phytomonospora sp. NPDC050363]|uniref:hypothetical protein n=1 Tax=Phytomonospora sp. NPDC050363 TaxID=3155642 RepID=UPI0033FFF26E
MRWPRLGLASALLLAGCAATPNATPAPPPQPPAEVTAAYEAYWSAWEHAQHHGEDDRLPKAAADPLLTSLRQGLREQAEYGGSDWGTVEREVLGVEARGSGWAFAACVDFDGGEGEGLEAPAGAVGPGTEVGPSAGADATPSPGNAPKDSTADGMDAPPTLVTVVLRPREGAWKAVGMWFGGTCG